MPGSAPSANTSVAAAAKAHQAKQQAKAAHDEASFVSLQRSKQQHEAMLKRRSIKSGVNVEEMREIYDVIPQQHKDEVLDRRSLKHSSLQCMRKVGAVGLG